MLAVVLAVGMQVVTPGERLVAVQAEFVPRRAGSRASVAVTFTPQEPDVRVNQEPPPRLKLDPDQGVLEYRAPAPPPPRRAAPSAHQPPRYLEPAIPYAFPVTLKPGAPKGEHRVKGSVTYFYCSKTAGWCRKGTDEVDVPVTVP
jgi:hypothetical protein